MPDAYEQHRASFARIAAYVVMRDGERVATIAFKFPRDGAGRLYAYVQWSGAPMVRGHATGYSKDDAACADAARKLRSAILAENARCVAKGYSPVNDAWVSFVVALASDERLGWERRLADASFTVHKAV